ncbi:MAG TPA: class I SAM-dependent methyltransferase, partial [Acidimicrobiia bacterium]|nr:class I SAM-dependent methyltransferase [Acidimicrobiia bacterium]
MSDPTREEPLAAAAAHASLGLPLPAGTRLRRLKRLFGLPQRSINHHQVAYNVAVLEALRTIRVHLERQTLERAARQSVVDSEVAIVAEQVAQFDAVSASTATQVELLAASLAELADDLRATRSQVTAVEAAHAEAHRRELARRAVDRLLPAPRDPKGAAIDSVRLDSELMFELENVFRGTFDEVRARLRAHLDTVRATRTIGPTLDLGCGRGEWLTLLAEEGIDGYGVDYSSLAVESCGARGLRVVEHDALEHLEKCDDASFGAVTAFHLIEHLEPPAMLRLFAEVIRVLRTGGVFIVETPNVANLIVGASTFHLDPTHVTPIHPLLLE